MGVALEVENFDVKNYVINHDVSYVANYIVYDFVNHVIS